MPTLRVVIPGEAAGLPAAALFKLLWDALVDLLGTSATATLLTRAARRALPRCLELRDLAIARVNHEFSYVVPLSFHRTRGPPAALRELLVELRSLLAESTGEVALRHLEQVPELRNWEAAASRSL